MVNARDALLSTLSVGRESAAVAIDAKTELGDNIRNEEKLDVKISRSLSQRSEQRSSQRVSQGASVALVANFCVEEGQLSGERSTRLSQRSRQQECAAVSIGEEPEHDDDIDSEEKVSVESSRRLSQRSEQRAS